jgi:hypothetical protein
MMIENTVKSLLTTTRSLAGRRAQFGQLVAVLAVAAAPYANAQNLLAEWNVNDRTSSATFLAPTSGANAASGIAAGYGQSNPALPFSSVLTTGTPIDAGTLIGDPGTLYNLAYVVNPPLTSAANNSVGMSFKVSTVGMASGEAVRVSWSQTVGWRSSRYWQLLATTDGTTWNVVPTGTGSSFSGTVNGFSGTAAPFTPISGTASVTVSNSGLIDFQTINLNSLSPSSTTTAPLDPYDVGFVNNISFTFPTGLGFENNANFGFAIVGSFDPSYVGTDGAVGLVGSFSGLNSSDITVGYNRSVGSGGSMRLDMVAVTAVPEPSTYALLAGGLCLGLALLRRRQMAGR